MNSWLPLTEYSNKHKVSISTLRRKIKAEEIKYVFEDGKYLILDGAKDHTTEVHRPSQGTAPYINSFSPQDSALKIGGEKKEDEPVITAANRLLMDLKKAYTQILQEKEEQIVRLKHEVVDLKTLVTVLESDNERLRKR